MEGGGTEKLTHFFRQHRCPTMPLEEEATKDGGCHNEEDTSPKPRGSCLAGVGITAGKLVVDLDTTDKTNDSTDGINEFCAGIKVGSHHFSGCIDTGHAVTLGISSCRCDKHSEQDEEKFLLIHNTMR